MVRNGHIFPPAYPIALSGLATLYLDAYAFRSSFFCLFAIVLSLAGVVTILILRRRSTPDPARNLLPIACLFVGILSGGACALRLHEVRASLVTLAEPSSITTLYGTLLGDPVPWGEDLYRVDALVSSARYADGSRFSTQGRAALLIPSSMERASLPGGLSSWRSGTGENVLLSEGRRVGFVGRLAPYTADEGERFTVIDVVASSAGWRTPVHAFRGSLRLALTRTLYDWGAAGGFLLALFSGNRDYLDPTLALDFKRTGLSHILALSGMHLSLMALVAIRVGKRIGGKRLSIRLSLVAIVVFVWFAGLSPSLNRALIMAILTIALKRLGFEVRALPILAATAFIQMLASPSDATSLAFLLSYGALWGILTFGASLIALAPSLIPGKLIESLSASIGAQLMTSPILALSVGCVAPIGIVASCLLGPLSSLFLVVGMALVLLTVLCPPAGRVCGNLARILYDMNAIPVSLFARIPPLSIDGLPATITAGFLPVAAGLCVVVAAVQCLKRRSSDDGFTRL